MPFILPQKPLGLEQIRLFQLRISLRSIREGSRVPLNITVILTVLPGVPGSCREVLGSGSFSCQWTLMSQHSLGKKIPQQ